MPSQQLRAVWWLGFCQCVLWGVLYYSFSVLLMPMEMALKLPRTAVAGAFSLALLVTALAAPAVGRRLDQGQAEALFRLGFALALAGLALIATAHHGVQLYLGWTAVGVAMALLLYEPAFALVIRAVVDPAQRLRALAAVTVLGGLASSVFLPLLSWLVAQADWRAAVAGCMVAVLASAWLIETRVIPALPAAVPAGALRAVSPVSIRWPPSLPSLALIFALGTFASMALTTLLIPLLIERGVSPAIAATVLAALGIAQLPGRIWMLRSRAASSQELHMVPIALQGAGLLAVVLATQPWISALAVALFGLGAGLQTLFRPWLVQRLYGEAEAGRWNGEVARIQGFARAAGPVAAAGAAWLGGTSSVLAGLGVLVLLTLPLARRLPV